MQPSATIFGYGAQGRAQARILHERGWQVRVVVRPGSPRIAETVADGLPVMTDWIAAAREAQMAALLIPDTEQAAVYREHLAPYLPQGACLIFPRSARHSACLALCPIIIDTTPYLWIVSRKPMGRFQF